jgi:hypothetical protein
LLPLLVAFRVSVSTSAPPICTATGAVGCGACSAGVAGCCRQPAAARTNVARTPAKPLHPLCIDTFKNLPFSVRRRSVVAEKKQKSYYAVFPNSLTIGYELHPPTNPRFAHWFACWKPRRGRGESWSDTVKA